MLLEIGSVGLEMRLALCSFGFGMSGRNGICKLCSRKEMVAEELVEESVTNANESQTIAKEASRESCQTSLKEKR